MAVINQAMRTHVIICLITHMVLSVLSVSANKIDQPISFNHDRSVSTNKNHDRKLLLSLPVLEYGGQDTDPVCRQKNPALCEQTGGYPNYFESAQLALTNWARMDPADYQAKWQNTYSCNTKKLPPVTWETELNQAARFQSYMLGKPDCDFQHVTCSKYCHLFGGCGTKERIAAYATHRGNENIAAGQSNPVSVTNGWLKSEGHCQGFFSDKHTRLGVGYQKTNTGPYYHYWTMNFGKRSAKYSSLKIPSGSHIHGYPTNGQTTFFVSYYNPGGRAPTEVTAVIGGKEYSLATTSRVSATAKTYFIAIDTPSCVAYHFLISADRGSHRHPVSTDYKTYGTSSCPEPLVHPKGSSKPTPTNEVTMALDGLCKSSFAAAGIKGQWKSSYTSSKCKCDCMKQNPCGIVRCVDNDRSSNCNVRTGHANQCICSFANKLNAKDGTPCGTGKMCLAGKCSARPSSHSVAALVDPDKVSGASTNTNTSTSTITITSTASPAFTLATLAILLPIIAAVGN